MNQSVFEQHEILDKLYLELKSFYQKGEIATYEQLLKIAPNLSQDEYEVVIERFKSHVRQKPESQINQVLNNVNDNWDNQLSSLQQEFFQSFGRIVAAREQKIAQATKELVDELNKAQKAAELELINLKASFEQEKISLTQELEALRNEVSLLKAQKLSDHNKIELMMGDHDALALLMLLGKEYGVETLESLPFHPNLNSLIVDVINQVKLFNKEQISSLASLVDKTNKVAQGAKDLGVSLSAIIERKYDKVVKEHELLAKAKAQDLAQGKDKSPEKSAVLSEALESAQAMGSTKISPALSEQEQALKELKEKFKHIEQLGADNSYFMEDDSFDRHDEPNEEAHELLSSQFQDFLKQASALSNLSGIGQSQSAALGQGSGLEQNSDPSQGAALGQAGSLGQSMSTGQGQSTGLYQEQESLALAEAGALKSKILPNGFDEAALETEVLRELNNAHDKIAFDSSQERMVEGLNVIAHDLLAKKAAHELSYHDIGQALQTAVRMEIGTSLQMALMGRLLLKIIFLGFNELKVSDFNLSDDELINLLTADEQRSFVRNALSWLKSNAHKCLPSQNPLASLISVTTNKSNIKNAYSNLDYQVQDFDVKSNAVEIINSSVPKAIPRDEGTLVREMSSEGGDDNIAAFAAASAKIASLAPLLHEAGKELKQTQKELDEELENSLIKDRLTSLSEESKASGQDKLNNSDSPSATVEITSVAKDVLKVASELELSGDDKPNKKFSLFDNSSEASEHTGTTVFGVENKSYKDSSDNNAFKDNYVQSSELSLDEDDESLDDFITGNITDYEHEDGQDPLLKDSQSSSLNHDLVKEKFLKSVTEDIDKVLASKDKALLKAQDKKSVFEQGMELTNEQAQELIQDKASKPGNDSALNQGRDLLRDSLKEPNRYLSASTMSNSGKTAIIKTISLEDGDLKEPETKESYSVSLDAAALSSAYKKGNHNTVIMVNSASDKIEESAPKDSMQAKDLAGPSPSSLAAAAKFKQEQERYHEALNAALESGQNNNVHTLISSSGQESSNDLNSDLEPNYNASLNPSKTLAPRTAPSASQSAASSTSQSTAQSAAPSFTSIAWLGSKDEVESEIEANPAQSAKPSPEPEVVPNPAQSAKPSPEPEVVPNPAQSAKPDAEPDVVPNPAQSAKPGAEPDVVPNPVQGAKPSAEPEEGQEQKGVPVTKPEVGPEPEPEQSTAPSQGQSIDQGRAQELESEDNSALYDLGAKEDFKLKTELNADEQMRFALLCLTIDKRINERASKINNLLMGSDKSSVVQLKEMSLFYKSCISSLDAQGLITPNLRQALYEKMDYDLKSNKSIDPKDGVALNNLDSNKLMAVLLQAKEQDQANNEAQDNSLTSEQSSKSEQGSELVPSTELGADQKQEQSSEPVPSTEPEQGDVSGFMGKAIEASFVSENSLESDKTLSQDNGFEDKLGFNKLGELGSGDKLDGLDNEELELLDDVANELENKDEHIISLDIPNAKLANFSEVQMEEDANEVSSISDDNSNIIQFIANPNNLSNHTGKRIDRHSKEGRLILLERLAMISKKSVMESKELLARKNNKDSFSLVDSSNKDPDSPYKDRKAHCLVTFATLDDNQELSSLDEPIYLDDKQASDKGHGVVKFELVDESNQVDSPELDKSQEQDTELSQRQGIEPEQTNEPEQGSEVSQRQGIEPEHSDKPVQVKGPEHGNVPEQDIVPEQTNEPEQETEESLGQGKVRALDWVSVSEDNDEELLAITPANAYVKDPSKDLSVAPNSKPNKEGGFTIMSSFSSYQDQGFGNSLNAYIKPSETSFMFQNISSTQEPLKTSSKESEKSKDEHDHK